MYKKSKGKENENKEWEKEVENKKISILFGWKKVKRKVREKTSGYL